MQSHCPGKKPLFVVDLPACPQRLRRVVLFCEVCSMSMKFEIRKNTVDTSAMLDSGEFIMRILQFTPDTRDDSIL